MNEKKKKIAKEIFNYPGIEKSDRIKIIPHYKDE